MKKFATYLILSMLHCVAVAQIYPEPEKNVDCSVFIAKERRGNAQQGLEIWDGAVAFHAKIVKQECCSMINMVKLPTNKSSLFLRVAKGHFATSHSHINYYIDVTTQKARLSEAKAVAKELVAAYQHSTIVDTVLCLDGTQVIGTCLANELTKDGFANMNAHQTIYVITPEYTSGSQILLRDNLAPMVKGKHVLILAASITTGYTAQAAVEAVNYYGGMVAGLSAIFATTHECAGIPVTSIFDPASLPDYASFDSRECPMCKAGQKIDALVNSFGYSTL